MERQVLRITIVLGMVVTLVGGTGIFATFTDRATAGTSTVSSGERPKAADLKIAAAAPESATGLFNCGTYADDLAGSLITGSDLQPGQTAGQAFLCVENAGSGTASVSATVTDLVDTDLGCTGDEAAAGDSCDVVGDPGELGSLILLDYELLECATAVGQEQFQFIAGYTEAPSFFAGTPWDFLAGGTMAPGAVACFHVAARYRPDVTEQQAQLAQTDQLSWTFAFDATVQ
jgi:hypothetical protein